MKRISKILLLSISMILVVGSVYGQTQKRLCYDTNYNKGMDAFNSKKYDEAKAHFITAGKCSDRRGDTGYNVMINKCNNAINEQKSRIEEEKRKVKEEEQKQKAKLEAEKAKQHEAEIAKQREVDREKKYKAKIEQERKHAEIAKQREAEREKQREAKREQERKDEELRQSGVEKANQLETERAKQREAEEAKQHKADSVKQQEEKIKKEEAEKIKLEEDNKKSITVQVYDKDGYIIGASVIIEGTSDGGMTDINGRVKLYIGDGDWTNKTLVIMYVGFNKKYVSLNNQLKGGAINVDLTSNFVSNKDYLRDRFFSIFKPGVYLGYGVSRLSEKDFPITGGDINIGVNTAFNTGAGLLPSLSVGYYRMSSSDSLKYSKVVNSGVEISPKISLLVYDDGNSVEGEGYWSGWALSAGYTYRLPLSASLTENIHGIDLKNKNFVNPLHSLRFSSEVHFENLIFELSYQFSLNSIYKANYMVDYNGENLKLFPDLSSKVRFFALTYIYKF